MLLGSKCFPPEFWKNNLLLFNICISMKSYIDPFHLDVLFEIYRAPIILFKTPPSASFCMSFLLGATPSP